MAGYAYAPYPNHLTHGTFLILRCSIIFRPYKFCVGPGPTKQITGRAGNFGPFDISTTDCTDYEYN